MRYFGNKKPLAFADKQAVFCCRRDQTENDEPHPQVVVAFGLRITN